jgi:hypothetical protein
MHKFFEIITAGVVGIIYMVAGPVTFVLNVIDTWQQQIPVWAKLLVNLTLDAFLAMIWPVTWVLWIILEIFGRETPLSTVLGF